MFFHNGVGFRPLEECDLEDVRRLRNDQSTWIHLSDPTLISSKSQKAWFESLSQSKDKVYYAVFKMTKEFPIIYRDFLGIIRMDQYDPLNRSARIGCDIVLGKRGEGYGTKTFRAIMFYLFNHLGLHRLWLCVLEGNEVAKKLYENVGFKEEGRMRDAVFRDGMYKDYVVMSILHDEYRKLSVK